MNEPTVTRAYDDTRPEAIGRRLGLVREAFGLTRAQIADMIDLDRSHWTRFENGERAIPFEKAGRITARFGVSLDFIYLGRIAGMEFATVERLRAAGLQ